MEGDSNALAPIARRAVLDGLLTQEDERRIKTELWHLLAWQTERYTMGDSTSVPVETAGELLRSLCFTIALRLEAAGERGALLLRDTPLPELLRAGRAELEARVKTGRERLRDLKEHPPGLCNVSYRDTLAGLETFFKRYDPLFFAHAIPCDIDYQLCLAVPGRLEGIAYINEYLRRLLAENKFCGQFETGARKALLDSYCADYEGLLVNLYEPVAVNALGLALLEGDILALNITDRDRSKLLERMKDGGKARLSEDLARAAEALCRNLGMEDAGAGDYLRETAAALCPRLEAAVRAGRLDGVFLPLEAAASGTVFADGERTDRTFRPD